MFPETIETERLRLERLTMEHLFECYEHASVGAPDIEEITRYVTWSPHRSLKETQTFIEEQADQWESGEGATYVVYPRDGETNAGEFGGCTGLSIDWPRRTGTLGLWLRKPLWGRGYSGERAQALMALAFERLDLDLVAVSHHPDNDRSESAIRTYVEAHGGRREGHLRKQLVGQDGRIADEVRYSVTQTEYNESRERAPPADASITATSVAGNCSFMSEDKTDRERRHEEEHERDVTLANEKEEDDEEQTEEEKAAEETAREQRNEQAATEEERRSEARENAAEEQENIDNHRDEPPFES